MINDQLLDKWSPVHFLSGLVLGQIQLSRPIAYGILIGYEIIENLILKRFCTELFSEEENMLNILSDTGMGIIGYETGVTLTTTNTKP